MTTARRLPRFAGRAIVVGLVMGLSSACGLEGLFLPPGDARWALPPGADVGPETSEFTAMVTEVECASGQSSAGRVLGPDIDYAEDSVTVTFWVRRLGSSGTCPSNPSTPVQVRLDEPLGDRVLLDGGTDTPREPPVCADPVFCE